MSGEDIMERDRAGSNDGPSAAQRAHDAPADVIAPAHAWLGAGLWGLMCAVLWHGAWALLDRRPFENVFLGFYLASVGASIASARFVPRVHGSVVLLAVVGLIGGATSFLVTTKSGGAYRLEAWMVAVFLAAPLIALRLLLDLFARRWSAGARRVAACVLAPVMLRALMFLVDATSNRSGGLNRSDWMVVISFAALGLAITPPRRVELPRAH